RVDTLFGNDWQFTKDFGLFDNAFPRNHFAGLDLPQIYGEVHLPILTPRGLDLRAGRFYSLTGFESPQAIARPLLSVPYSMNYTPFTFFGAIASLHLSERLSVFSGTIDGFDRWPNEPYKWGYIGALTWTSRDQKTTLVIGGADAFEQLPRFLPTYATFVPVGVPAPPFLAGRRNPYYNKSGRGYTVGVLTHKWTEKLTQAVETDAVFDQMILGFGRDPYVPHSAAYYGFVNWFLYQFNEKVMGVWRSEVFWDPYGLATGVADTYHEITLGLNIRPQPWLWVRPEARYDWAQFGHPYNDGTRSSQLTLGFDVILLF
ncbi:MAG: outer membrane beta-barrel protein, partial [Isosphaeraceae bacterium]